MNSIGQGSEARRRVVLAGVAREASLSPNQSNDKKSARYIKICRKVMDTGQKNLELKTGSVIPTFERFSDLSG